MMKKKVIISSAAVLVLAIAVYFIFLGSSTRKYDFRFDKVTKGDINVLVTTTGTINAVVSVDVGTQVSGIISNLYADFNSVVKEGQVIARIDTTFLAQSVNDAEAALDGAKAKAADSKRTLDRETALLAKGLDSQAAYDAALTANESNQAQLKQAVASLDRSKINLAYATITAPISGVVINRAVNVGQTVAASFSSPLLYTIANDLTRMQVLTTVDESDIGMISIGENATFSVDAYPDQKFSGVVSQIRLAPVTVQNVVNYTVVIDVDNAELKLMPGMTANVNVGVASAHDVLKVSSLALRFQPPGELVDSSKVQAQREGFLGRGGSGGDSSGAGRSATDSSAKGPGSTHGNFGAIRDSIQAAHGGKLSQEELRAEIGKVFGKNRGSQQTVRPAPASRNVAPPPTGTVKYGITNLYAQFQKSPYVPQHQSGRAKVWILNAQRKLEPVWVRTGVTDGRYTEITSNNLKPGDQIVLGATSNSEVAQASSPLTGGGQQRPPGGGGFR
ncbi:MAG: efflux RND transporter periplasmic adaptor subunit [Bacteroidota bacterium]|jgi:HlyD family secretion protein